MANAAIIDRDATRRFDRILFLSRLNRKLNRKRSQMSLSMDENQNLIRIADLLHQIFLLPQQLILSKQAQVFKILYQAN